MKTVAFESLKSFGIRILENKGVPSDAAEYTADIITQAEAYRQSTHGIVQFKALSDSFGKSLDPDAQPRIVSDRGATLLIDADRCMGLWAFKTAIDGARKKAEELGTPDSAARSDNSQ